MEVKLRPSVSASEVLFTLLTVRDEPGHKHTNGGVRVSGLTGKL